MYWRRWFGSSEQPDKQINLLATVPWQQINIQASQLTLGYESLEHPILTDLTHTFDHGKVHGIIGVSGSGKSTLISALLCLHSPSAGLITVQSHSASPQILGSDLSIHDWILNVGYLSQQPFLFQGTVKENHTLRIPGAIVNEQKALELVQQLHLSECLGPNPLEFELQEGGSNLSGGNSSGWRCCAPFRLNVPSSFWMKRRAHWIRAA